MASLDSQLPAKRAKQQFITKWDTSGSVRSAAMQDAQVDFFLHERLAFRLADSPHLHKWLELYRQSGGEVMGRKQLSLSLQRRVDGVMEQVLAKLRLCHGVTIGVDGWTNVRHDKVINICPVGRGVAYYWNSVVLKEYADADSQCGPISTHITKIVSEKVRVVGLVIDNEAVNGALYRRLRVEFPQLIHIPCAAHTIQLCVRKVMGLPLVDDIVNALLELLAAFKSSKDLRVRLKAQQGLLRLGRPPLQLISVCDTRWNATLFAAERVLELENCIRPFISDIMAVVKNDDYSYCDSTFWYPLKSLVNFLQPFKTATDIVQSDAATLAEVHEQFAALMVAADSLAVFASIRSDVIHCIRREWNSHVNISVVVMCALFSFRPAYDNFTNKQVTAADTWFEKWGTEFLHAHGLSETDDKDCISVLLQNQLSAFNQREGAFSDLDAIRARRARVLGKEQKHDDPRTMWGLKVRAAPELAACALALLDLTASEAAVERSFSQQNLIHSKQRNRLADDTVHLSMAFSFNSRALLGSCTHQSPGWEEIPDDYTPIDVVRGTFLLSYSDADIIAADDSIAPAVPGEGERYEVKEEAHDEGERYELKEEAESELGLQSSIDEEEKGELYEREDDPAAASVAAAMVAAVAAAVAAAPSTAAQAAEERINAFVAKYVSTRKITPRWKFTAVREGLLQAEIIAADLPVQVATMKIKIRAYAATQRL